MRCKGEEKEMCKRKKNKNPRRGNKINKSLKIVAKEKRKDYAR